MHNQAYVRRVDHVYVDLCPENLKNAKIEQNFKATNLTTYHAYHEKDQKPI